MQQDITDASDEAARKYFDETPEEERSDSGVTAVMQLLLVCHSLHSSRVPLHLLECLHMLPLLQMSSSCRGPCLL
jgi:hypothetical protein